MSKKYIKADRQQIIDDLFERLREYEDGASVTTWLLLKSEGYDMSSIEDEDLMDIDHALNNTAEEHDLTLDMSKHMFKLEGLPYKVV